MKLGKLWRDVWTSDAADARTPYQVASNQLGHASVALAVAQGLFLAGAPGAAWVAFALWAGAWEGLQYVRGRAIGRRVRRRWDWATDATAYGAGALAWSISGGLLGWAAGCVVVGLVVVGAALIWGE
jgi:hypothetical protein